jgi:hypothetical protein
MEIFSPRGATAMAKLGILGVAGLALAMLAVDAKAQRGGAARGGVRGAVVGEMVGGDSGAKVGAVVGATRGAANRTAMVAETQARAQYATTPAYMNATHSNFNEVPPQVLVADPAKGPAVKGGEAVLRKDGKSVAGITFPDDWKQQAADNHVSAVSADGQAWSVIAILDSVKDKQAGIEKAKLGLEKSLKDVKYDEPIKTQGGALVVTGTGKTMKTSTDVVFAAGVLESAPGQFVGLAFVVDDNVDDQYKETARYICQTIRLAKDLAK